MKAAVLKAVRQISVEDVPTPEIEPSDVLIHVKACGICPADVQKYNGSRNLKFPRILGHEFSGAIAAVGGDVSGLDVGQDVTADADFYCRRCHYCRLGIGNLCLNPKAYSGGFAEYVKVPYQNVFPLPGNISFEEATLSEPLACCIHGFHKLRLEMGDHVVIIGAGPMGLMLLQLLKMAGASAIVTEMISERRKLASDLGADATIDPNMEDPVAAVKKLTDGRGAEGVVVATGSVRAIESGVQMAAKLGRVVIFGAVFPPADIRLDPNICHYNEVVITGSEGYEFPRDRIYAIQVIASRRVDVKAVISHALPLDEAAKGFEIAERTAGLRVLLQP